MARASIGRTLEFAGVGIFGVSVLLFAYSEYLFTYANLHLTGAPAPSVYDRGWDAEIASAVLASVAGIVFGSGWVLLRRGEHRSTDPSAIAVRRGLSVGAGVGVVAGALFVGGDLLETVALVYAREGWQLAHSSFQQYFWGAAPEVLQGLGWVLGAAALYLVRRR